jgi:hypothetical protein
LAAHLRVGRCQIDKELIRSAFKTGRSRSITCR